MDEPVYRSRKALMRAVHFAAREAADRVYRDALRAAEDIPDEEIARGVWGRDRVIALMDIVSGAHP